MVGEILLIILSFLIVIAGGLGVILPLLPGVPAAWLGLLLFAYVTEFIFVSWKALLIFLGLVILTLLLDLLAPLMDVGSEKARRYGLIGSALGAIFGLMIFGPIGIVIGPFAGAFLGEMLRGKNWDEAAASAKGTLVGILIGSAIKFAVVIIMMGYMILALF